jgi:hypothetical protein
MVEEVLVEVIEFEGVPDLPECESIITTSYLLGIILITLSSFLLGLFLDGLVLLPKCPLLTE